MKKMKWLLTSLVAASLSLAGCGKQPTSESASEAKTGEVQSEVQSETPSVQPSETTSDVDENVVITRVEFGQMEKLEVNKGDAVKVSKDLVVKGFYQDGGQEVFISLVAQVSVKQGDKVIPSTGNFDTKTPGTYDLVYSVNPEGLLGFTFAAGVTLTANRQLVVNEIEVSGEELIHNGDFSDGATGWGTYTDGSSATFGYDDGVLKVTETSISGNSYSPRLNTDYSTNQYAFSLQYGVSYCLSIDLKADAPRTIRSQIGTLLSSDPWWASASSVEESNAVGLGAASKYDLIHDFAVTTTMTTYTWTFTLSSASVETAHLTLEMGTINGDANISAVTNIYVDNISLKAMADDGQDKIPPQITCPATVRVALDPSATQPVNVLEGVSASDNVDGDLTSSITYVIKDENDQTVESFTAAQEGTYTVTYTVKDAAENEKTAVSVFKVRAASSVFEPAYNDVKTDLTFAGEDDKADDTMVYWNDQNWCGQNVTVSKSYEENKEYHFAYSSTGNSFYGAGFQVFYNNSDLTDGETYTVSFDLTSSAAGRIRVNGQEVDIVEGANKISVEYVEGKSSLAFINGTMTGGANPQTIDAAEFTIANLKWSQPITYEPKYNDVKTDLTFAGEDDKADDTMVFWNDQNWCGQNVTVSKSYEENKEYHFAYSSTGNSFYGAGFQVFYNNSDLTDGETYTVSFDLTSSAAGRIRVNGQEVDIVEGANKISVEYVEGKSSLAFINGTMTGGANPQTIDAAEFTIANLMWK